MDFCGFLFTRGLPFLQKWLKSGFQVPAFPPNFGHWLLFQSLAIGWLSTGRWLKFGSKAKIWESDGRLAGEDASDISWKEEIGNCISPLSNSGKIKGMRYTCHIN